MFIVSRCCMFIPGAIDAAGVGDAGMRIPGAMVGPGFTVAGGELGAVVMPGIGAIVGAGDGFAAVVAGSVFFAGAGVAIGIPGMGALVGCAARAGETATETKKAAMPRRVTSNGTSSEYQAYYAS